MLISVVVPSHNRSGLLLNALRAISRQTLEKDLYEVIVVASACTDDTVERVRPLLDERLRLTEVRNGTPARSRNAGAALARGKYLAFTDDDCEPEPGWLAAFLRVIEADSSRAGIGGRTITRDEGRTPLTHQVENAGGMDLLPTCNLFVKREVFEELGGFNEEFLFLNEDTDFSWRLEAFGLDYCPEAVVVHPPRPGTFKARVQWMRNLESEFALADRHSSLYAVRRRSPWYWIYWHMMVRTHLRYLKSAFGDILIRKRPDWCLIRLALIFARSGYCLFLFPSFREARGVQRAGVAPARTGCLN